MLILELIFASIDWLFYIIPKEQLVVDPTDCTRFYKNRIDSNTKAHNC